MTNLAELARDADLSALREWLDETGTLDIADELTRLDPPARVVPFRIVLGL